MIDFTEQVALVTGAARGIGRATAEKLAEAGARLVLTDLGAPLQSLDYDTSSWAGLEATATQIRSQFGTEVLTVPVDVRDIGQLRTAVDECQHQFGRLDVVVANAGIASWPRSTWEATQGEWDDMIGVVLTGTWNTLRASVPTILRGGRGGAIVVIGSTAAVRPLPTIGHYAAAKMGLVGLVKSLALELAPQSVRINLVHPGGTGTDMTENPAAEHWQATFGGAGTLDLPMPIHRMEAVDIAHAVRWFVSAEARYITGTELVVDAGATL